MPGDPDITSSIFPDSCRPLNFIGAFFSREYNGNLFCYRVVFIDVVRSYPDILMSVLAQICDPVSRFIPLFKGHFANLIRFQVQGKQWPVGAEEERTIPGRSDCINTVWTSC